MCFPHVDEDTKSVLQTVMRDAENYNDFTEKLCAYVCSKTSTQLLQYLAVFFPFHIGAYTVIDRLELAGKIPDLANPLLLIRRASLSPSYQWDDMKKSIATALEAAPNDWIACQLYLVWRYWIEQIFPEADIDIQPIEAIKTIVETNIEFTYFKWYLLMFNTWQYMRETKRELAIDTLKQALATVRKYDDLVSVADILCILAGHIKHTDVEKAIDLFNTSREICKKLGYRAGLGQVQHHMGHIMGFRGELDAAIRYQTEFTEIVESLGHDTEYLKSLIALFHNQAGNGEKAYQLALPMVELGRASIRHNAFPQANLAWALTNLGRYDEARDELALALDLGIKSGSDSQMMWVHLVEGILDKAERNYDSAIAAFEEVLKHLEDDPTPAITNICLLNLTEIEIDSLPEEHVVRKSESSGPWMEQLMDHITKNDFPGIAAQLLLLQAKLRYRQGQDDEVKRILAEVHKTAESLSMKYLNNLAISMFPDIVII